MNDAQSTIAGLKYQRCPGGGWNGMPAELDGEATVADCLAHGGCGCIYGDAVQHIERLLAALKEIADMPPLIQYAGVEVKPIVYDAEQRIARKALSNEQNVPGID